MASHHEGPGAESLRTCSNAKYYFGNSKQRDLLICILVFSGQDGQPSIVN